jgi:hypothetical protein
MCSGEKVGVAKIRIRQSAAHSMAVLGSFVAADRLLKSWATGRRDQPACEFEIIYLDGSELSGLYPMRQKCTTRQSLGAYVRRVIEQMDGLASIRFGAGRPPARFLDEYEVEDFAERDLP